MHFRNPNLKFDSLNFRNSHSFLAEFFTIDGESLVPLTCLDVCEPVVLKAALAMVDIVVIDPKQKHEVDCKKVC